MPITELAVEGYRSIRKLRLRLKRINVLTGPNGCGKSNLYQSMVLLAAAANGQLARTLAEEGGMPSVLWAGKKTYKADTNRVTLGVTLDSFGYELSAGLPIPDETHSDYGIAIGTPSLGHTAFDNDPLIKTEDVWVTHGKSRRIALLQRKLNSAHVRDKDGVRMTYPMALLDSESSLSQIREPHLYPELSVLRQEMTGWRFYHHFRTDQDSPLRHPQVGVRTPALASDGSDLAAALQTILENGDAHALAQALDSGLPGHSLSIENSGARFSVMLKIDGLLRPLKARELSDGTLRYLCLLAALLSPRPPAVLALNEPETSLHPDLIKPLASLIVRASENSQLWITTHCEALAEHIERLSGQRPVRLEKIRGETRIVGQGLLGQVDDEEDRISSN